MLDVATQEFAAFLGDDQSQSVVLLPRAYSSGGSVNLWIDKLGRIRQRLGHSKQNAVGVLTSGGSATTLVGLYAYRKTAGGALSRKLIGVFDDGSNEWEIHVSDNEGVSWTLLENLGAGPVGRRPSFVQYGDLLYIVNGVTTARVYNGTSLAVAGAAQLPSPAIADAGAGPLNGQFQWRIVPATATGRKPGSLVSANTSLQNRRVTVSWNADADVDVTGYYVYRTRGSGRIFYEHSFVEGRTNVSLLDTKSDIDLIGGRALQEHGDPPPTGARIVFQHQSRVFWLGTDAEPTTAAYSDPGDADSVWTFENKINFAESADMGDFATAGVGDFEKKAVVFLERAVHVLSGDGEVIGVHKNWVRRRSNAEMGAVSQDCVLRIPAGAKWLSDSGDVVETAQVTLAYVTPLADVRLFNGTDDTIISGPVVDTLQAWTYADRGKVWGFIDKERSHAVWVSPADQTAVVWDFGHGTWHKWDHCRFACGAVVESPTVRQTVLVGESSLAVGGFCYKLWNGSRFDADSITATLMFKPYYAAEPGSLEADYTRTKRFRFVDLLFEPMSVPAVATMEWLTHIADDTDAPAAGDSLDNISTSGRQRVDLQGADATHFCDFGLRLRLTTTGIAAAWCLNGMRLTYQTLPGTKRAT